MALQSLRNGWKETANLINDKLKDKVSEFLRKYANAELFVTTGFAGVGKSSFNMSVTNETVYVGSTLKSGTTTTSLVPAVIGDKRCLFLDMPGFNTRDFSDWDIFERLMIGLSVVQSYVQFRGILYIDSMDGTRETDASEKILKWLFLFCGPRFMPCVTIVTTRWDNLNEDGIETKLSLIEQWKASELFKPFFDNGAKMYHHGLYKEGNTYRTLHIDRMADRRRWLAREMIATHYEGATDLRPQIHIDIENGASLETTQAGRWLKYGYARHAQHERETRAEAPPEDEFCDDASDSDSGTDGGWGKEFAEFWSNPERVKPWVNLLFRAIKAYTNNASLYAEPSFPGGSNFRGDMGSGFHFSSADYFPADEFDGDTGIFEDDGPEPSSVCRIL